MGKWASLAGFPSFWIPQTPLPTGVKSSLQISLSSIANTHKLFRTNPILVANRHVWAEFSICCLSILCLLGVALLFVTLLEGILGSLKTFLFAETTNRIDQKLGSEVIDHLLRLPLNYFDKRPVGELGSRIDELEKIREFLTGQALSTILDAVFSVLYILVMFI